LGKARAPLVEASAAVKVCLTDWTASIKARSGSSAIFFILSLSSCDNDLISSMSLSQASNSAILAHFRAHPFSRSQLKLPFLFEVAGVSECSGLSHNDSGVPGSLSSATPTLWELHGPAIPGFTGSMPKSRQSWEGGGLGPVAIPSVVGTTESRKRPKDILMWEKKTKVARNRGENIFFMPST
jgi:hypothetical protein